MEGLVLAGLLQIYFKVKIMFKNLYMVLIILGLAVFLLFYPIRYSIIGISFLMELTAFFGIFIFLLGISMMPVKGRTLFKVFKVFRIFFISMFLFGAVIFAVIEGIIFANSQGDAPEKTDVIIVLGAGLYGNSPSLTLISRLDGAIEYMEKYPDTICVVSGGQGKTESIPEGTAMRRYMLDRGIADERIIVESYASSTIENMRNSFRLIGEQLGQLPVKVGIVSNEFHMYRSKLIAENFGITPVMIACQTPQIGLIPVNCWVREFFSVILFYVKNTFCKDLFVI